MRRARPTNHFQFNPSNDYSRVMNSALFGSATAVSSHKKPYEYDGADKDFCQNQWKLFEEGVHDTIIYVGPEKKEFKILKFPFMAQSPVFKAMFQNNTKEAKENTVTIRDMDEKTMLALIKWLYMSKFDDDGETVEGLFKAADKYQIEALKSKCIERLGEEFDIKNVLSRYAIAVTYKLDDLKEKILAHTNKMSRKDLAKCLMSKEWDEFKAKKLEIATQFSELVLEKL